MSLAAYLVIIGVLVMIVALVKDAMRPGLVLFSGAVLFMAAGIITPEEMTAGFSNRGVLTVAVLFLVSEGIRYSGVLGRLAQIILPKKKKSMAVMLSKVIIPTSALSAFMNNTPVVIIFAPVIKRWSEELKISPSKFLIPLSYATIFGGICTLIGTSTNLVVDGMMQSNGYEGLGFFELAKVGFFIALAGWAYVSFVGHRLLPDHKNAKSLERLDIKEYYFTLKVNSGSKYVGRVVDKGLMKDHPDLSVVCIERGSQSLNAAGDRYVLQENDQLLVCGYEENIENILSLNELELIAQGDMEGVSKTEDLHRIEVVLAPRFPGIGSTLEDFDFYSRYQGTVIAIHRNGSSITTNLKKERLRAGDSLIILAEEEFVESWKESKIFFLISSKGEVERPVKTYKIGWTVATVLIMVLGATFGEYMPTIKGNQPDMFIFASIAAVMMAVLRIFPPKKYARAISWDVLITIASAFAISKAMMNSGAAESIAHVAINTVKHLGPVAVLAIIYILTMVFTEIITNNAAAAMAFPIALSAAQQLGVDPKPFFVAICMAASASFSTPIGYQTNLIVQSIGNYKFRDYLRVGLPMNLIALLISIWLIPLIWKF